MNKPLEGSAADFVHPEDEPTIELVLSAEDVAALSRAAEDAHSTSRPEPPAAALPPKVQQLRAPELQPPRAAPAPVPTRRGVLVLSVVASAVLLSGSVVYLATSREQPVQALVKTSPPPPPIETPPSFVNETPVRFQNPFDATEVFEFPSGTTETEARDAVADLLLKRALERQNPSTDVADGRTTTPGRHAPALRHTSLPPT